MTLYWYIFREHFLLTGIILAGVSCLFAGVRFAQLAADYAFEGLSLKEVIDLLFILIPGFLDLTIPISIILGSVAFCQRFALDKEISAMKSLGYSIAAVVKACISSTLIFACLHFGVLNFLRPKAQLVLESELARLVVNKVTSILPTCSPVDLGKLRVFVVKRQGDNLEQVFIALEAKGLELVYSKRGTLDYLIQSQGMVLTLEDGWNLSFGESVEFTNFSRNEFFESLTFKGVSFDRKTSQLGTKEVLNKLKFATFVVSEKVLSKLDRDKEDFIKTQLVLKDVSEHTVEQKLRTLKKELSRRMLAPLYDILLAVFAVIVGLNLSPKISSFYYPACYFAVIATFLISLFAIDAVAELKNSAFIVISEGFLVVLFILYVLCFRGFRRLKEQITRNGLQAIFGK